MMKSPHAILFNFLELCVKLMVRSNGDCAEWKSSAETLWAWHRGGRCSLGFGGRDAEQLSFHFTTKRYWTRSPPLFCLQCVLACCYSQQRTLMQAACRLFSARISDLMPMTRRLPKQVIKAMTQTDTRSTMLANRSSKEEMPSVLGLQDLTWGA